MQLYMAPMEGLTGYVYRTAYYRYYGNIDKYFTPFISNKKLSYKEINDISPENNVGMEVVPQILTNRADNFVCIAETLKEYGYKTVNLNLGCPSGTVVSKYRGAGFLALPEELDMFLSEIFDKCPLKISIKTRIGKDDPGEWERLLSIYEKYPMEELIIHPRVQRDFYKNTVNLEAFAAAVDRGVLPLCYNGDIAAEADYHRLMQRFPAQERVMLGRGILSDPELSGRIKGAQMPECERAQEKRKQRLRAFHDDILHGYQNIMSGDRNTLFKMKELWGYIGTGFTQPDKYMKKIRKADRLADYEIAVDALFREQLLLAHNCVL